MNLIYRLILVFTVIAFLGAVEYAIGAELELSTAGQPSAPICVPFCEVN